MRKGIIRTFISLSLTLSLTLTTISSPLLVSANQDEASLEETSNAITVDDPSSSKGVDNSSLDLGERQDQSAPDEINRSAQFEPFLPAGPQEYQTDRFLVKFKSHQGRSSLASSLSEDLKQVTNLKNDKLKDFQVITTKTEMKKEDFLAIINSKNAGGEIDYIQPDYKLTAASLDASTEAGQQDGSLDGQAWPEDQSLPEYLQGLPPDDPLVEQWRKAQRGKKEAQENTADAGTPVELADVNMQAAWEQSRGEGAIVALLDTGIDITHQDLARRIWTNPAETPGNGIDDDGNGYVDDTRGWDFTQNSSEVHRQGREYDEWHGTHLAGIIAGVAPQAKIMPLKVFQNGAAYTSHIIEAISYAERNGAQIANCSWGTSFDNPALEEAMAKSALLFVCAAGNSNADIGPSPVYPASYSMDNLLTVASLNRDGALSGYSNHGRTAVDVAAPGENIISATPGARHGVSSGTSQSAAFVSGEAALLLGAYKNPRATGIRQVIIQSCDKLPGLASQVIGGNKINCGSALSSPLPEMGEILTSQNNEDTSVADSVYQDILVPAPAYEGAGGPYSLYGGETWNIKASMPTARFGLAAAKANLKIYAMGGYNSSGYLNIAEEYNPATNTWTTKANMPTPRSYLAAAAVNGKIYVIGGYNGGYLNTVEEYDPATNTWTVKAAMPTPRNHLAAAAVNGKIYVIGGVGSGGRLNTVEEYNPATNTWTAKAAMPSPRSNLATAAVNGKIYAIGGTNDSGWLNTVEEYNPATNTWTTKAAMPSPRYGLAAAAANGKIYAIGGISFEQWLATVEEYDPGTNTWTAKAGMPTARSHLAAAAVGARIYAIGGFDFINAFNTLEELVLGTDDYGNDFAGSTTIGTGSTVEGWIDYAQDVDCFNFTPSASGSYIIESAGPTDMYGSLYNSSQALLTGDDDSGENLNFKITAALQAGQTYYLKTRHHASGTGPYEIVISRQPDHFTATSPNSTTIDLSWDPVPAAAGYDLEVDGAVIDNGPGTAYTHGGLAANVLHIYRLRVKYAAVAGGWSKKLYALTQGSAFQIRSPLPTPRYGLAAAAANGKIYAIGGIGKNWDFFDTIEEYDPATDTWTTKAAMPTARLGLAAVTVNGKIYAIGNYGDYGYAVEEYDPATNTWTAKAAMPTPREGLAAAEVNGKIYAIGGYNSSGYANVVEEYNPATNTWTTKAAMPTPRSYLAAAAVNGKIYAIGGYSSSGYFNTVEEYNPATNTWTTKAAMPTPRNGLAAAAVDGKIYAMGGYNSSGYANTVEEYNPATNTWTAKVAMPINSRFLGAAALNDKVYAIGGYNADGYLDCLQELSTILPTDYFYDGLNRLNRVVAPDQTIEYQYDDNGNLIRRTVSP